MGPHGLDQIHQPAYADGLAYKAQKQQLRQLEPWFINQAQSAQTPTIAQEPPAHPKSVIARQILQIAEMAQQTLLMMGEKAAHVIVVIT
jgi:hypothetical protein